MRNLEIQEMELVSGGFEWEINIGNVVRVSGDGDDLANAYDWAVDQMSDFFTWWDPAGYYSGC
jgi:hypothetical protein